MITILDELLPGVQLLAPRIWRDERGEFVKTFHVGLYEQLGIAFAAAEEFCSTSHRNVLRGMHFQVPPHDHAKLVYCIHGEVRDVVIDLRRGSSGYGRCVSAVLSRSNRHMLLLPRGVAHGFLAIEHDSAMVYQTSTVHAPSHDFGIRWDSFGFDWEVASPIISARDAAFPVFAEFDSPF